MSEFIMTITIKPIPGMLVGCAQNKPGSPGILVPGVQAHVVHHNGSLAGPNEQGELLVRGDSAVLGYKGNDKVTRETFVDGWVRTGDQMRIDED
jgi:long-subunit acyl-CoA synthetase (AMP-forming)